MKKLLIGLLAFISLTAFAGSNFSKCTKDGQIIQLVHHTENNTDIVGRIDGFYIEVTAARSSDETGEFFIANVSLATILLRIENHDGEGILQIITPSGLTTKNLKCE